MMYGLKARLFLEIVEQKLIQNSIIFMTLISLIAEVFAFAVLVLEAFIMMFWRYFIIQKV